MTFKSAVTRGALRRCTGILPLAFAVLLGAVVGGCRTAVPKAAAADGSTGSPVPQQNVAKAPLADESPLAAAPPAAGNAGATATLPERKALPPAAATAEAYPKGLLQGIKDPDAKVKVMFNFDAAPVSDIVPLFAALLNFQYLIDPGVKGAISMTLDTELTAREVWEMFENLLWLSGAYASRSTGYIQIVPFAKMPQERRLFATHDPVANVEVALIRIGFARSAEVLNNLKPFMTEGANVTDQARLNSLLIVESPANMPKLRELITRLDSKGEADWPMKSIPCRRVDCEVLRDELLALLPILGYPVTDKASSGGEVKLTALPRLQTIVVSAALQDVVDEVERWVQTLDQENSAEQDNIFFYNVRHSTADHLNEALGVFFNTTGANSVKEPTSKATSSKATTRTSAGNNPYPNANLASPQPAPVVRPATPTTPKEKTEGQTVFDNPVVVYADTDQNRLTIRTSPRTYAIIDALLKRLDVPSRQVLIQAVIAEITLNKSTEFGFAYAATQKFGGTEVRGGIMNDPKVDGVSLVDAAGALVTPFIPQTAGIALLLSRGQDRLGFIKAVAGETNVKVISAPQVMASNDQEAVINVGNRVPIVTGEQTNTTVDTNTNNTLYQSVQYVDTGIILTVTPRITAGNEVNMDISQEVSDAVTTESSSINSPTIQTRKLNTKLVVPDGGTVLMGGLIKTKNSDSNNGLPWIKDIPLIGRLFRTNNLNNERTELLVMVTVNVVGENADFSKLASRYQAALAEIRKRMNQ